MDFLTVMGYGQSLVFLLIQVAAFLASLTALIHAAIQRPDAFTAVDRQTKVIWVSILTAASVFTLFFSISSAGSILAIAGIVAALVYLVDVRPRVDSIQGRSWFRKHG
ncbi:DUF2516 family protein [Gordonia asplenii]|uniref:DUF2516 family protein n=1 Tax=Gordonia asplenii TaxID=2725283 RepID=UPI0035E42D9F